MDWPAQTERSLIASIVGVGLLRISKVTGVPEQPPNSGVTVILAKTGTPAAAAVKLILPEPEAGRPMAVLSLLQLNVAPGVPVKETLMGCPEQPVWLPGLLTVGLDTMVMSAVPTKLEYKGHPELPVTDTIEMVVELDMVPGNTTVEPFDKLLAVKLLAPSV